MLYIHCFINVCLAAVDRSYQEDRVEIQLSRLTPYLRNNCIVFEYSCLHPHWTATIAVLLAPLLCFVNLTVNMKTCYIQCNNCNRIIICQDRIYSLLASGVVFICLLECKESQIHVVVRKVVKHLFFSISILMKLKILIKTMRI